MQVGKIYRQSELLIEYVWRADSVISRMRGLLWRPPLLTSQALLIAPCNSIHTFGMSYALDILFVDNKGKVLKLYKNLPSFRIAASLAAHSVIELAAGEAERIGLAVGDHLEWRPN